MPVLLRASNGARAIKGAVRLFRRLAESNEGLHDGFFDRTSCKLRVVNWLENHDPNTTNYFAEIPNSSDPSAIFKLTLPGCNEFCGKGTLYWDWLPRIAIWTIPILLLLSNLELTPIDKKRFTAIVRALGDPIDSVYSLVYKLYVWDRLYRISLDYVKDQTGEAETNDEIRRRARLVAAVLSGFEELSGALLSSEKYYFSILDQFYIKHDMDREQEEEILMHWSHTATTLVDSRTNDFLRTCLALTVYAFGIAQAISPYVGGGGTSVPGGRIACALFLSWLLPLVMLSNTFGSFPSRRTCLEAIFRFLKSMDLLHLRPRPRPRPAPERPFRICSYGHYFRAVPFLGAIYVYRPWKAKSGWWPRRCGLLALSAVPAVLGVVGSFLILWFAVPTGYGCRHSWVLGVFFAWVLSCVFTWTTGPYLSRHWHWWLTLIKDAVVGFFTVALPTASNLGWWNNCNCWSTSPWNPKLDSAYVPVGTSEKYAEYNGSIYICVISIFLALQVAFYFCITFYFWKGIQVVRWKEGDTRIEWERTHRLGDQSGDLEFLGFRRSDDPGNRPWDRFLQSLSQWRSEEYEL